MHNFFEHQDGAKRKTLKLLIIYLLILMLIVFGCVALFEMIVYSFSIYLHGGVISLKQVLVASFNAVNRPAEMIYASLVLLGLSGVNYTMLSRSGGGKIAESMGGRLMREPATEKENQFFNVLTEMSIASSIPRPDVYVIEREDINAFAAGKSYHNAVIGITRGALDRLSRNEIKGVLAHEFAHIANGDMLLNLRLLAALKGLAAVHHIGIFLIRGGSSSSLSRRNHASVMAMGFGLAILGYIGVLCGKLIQAAISRQREYLADATAVQFTRNPKGIAGALYKIHIQSKSSKSSGLLSIADYDHYYFASPLQGSGKGRFLWSKLNATHPDIQFRLDRLLPKWRSLSRSQDRESKDTANEKML